MEIWQTKKRQTRQQHSNKIIFINQTINKMNQNNNKSSNVISTFYPAIHFLGHVVAFGLFFLGCNYLIEKAPNSDKLIAIIFLMPLLFFIFSIVAIAQIIVFQKIKKKGLRNSSICLFLLIIFGAFAFLKECYLL